MKKCFFLSLVITFIGIQTSYFDIKFDFVNEKHPKNFGKLTYASIIISLTLSTEDGIILLHCELLFISVYLRALDLCFGIRVHSA